MWLARSEGWCRICDLLWHSSLARERMARFADAWMAIGLLARVLKEEIADESWRHRGPPDYERYRVIALQTLAQKLAIPPAPEDKP